MSDETRCYVCGLCWWTDCENDADYTDEVTLHDRYGRIVFDGKIELCGGHWRFVHERDDGRMNLRQEALDQAIEMQILKRSRARTRR